MIEAGMSGTSKPSATSGIVILVDADACPVKDEIYKVAARHALPVAIVANAPIAVPRDRTIRRIHVAEGPDVADDWIAARAHAATIVVTADIPLAARCVKVGASVIAPDGKAHTEATIGVTLATRNLMDSLRSAGEVTGGPAAVRAARPLGLPVRARPGDPAAEAAGVSGRGTARLDTSAATPGTSDDPRVTTPICGFPQDAPRVVGFDQDPDRCAGAL